MQHRLCLLVSLALGCDHLGAGGGPDAPGGPAIDSHGGSAIDGHGSASDGRMIDSGGATAPCKRGLAYGHHSLADLQALSPGISWWYNWALSPESAVASTYPSTGVEYMPMVWGAGSIAGADKAITTREHYLLTFNEPDFTNQANLTPQQAADLWPQIEQVADAHGLTIVSPALNYCGGGCNETDPFKWFDAFFAACQGCRVDHLAVHWYACTKDALTNYIGQMKKYGRPIWLTEFACLDGNDHSLATEQAYLADALDYLEHEPAVVRYSWFTGRFPQTPTIDLLGADGQLTVLGQQYVSAAAACRP
jgi:Glycosyl hydrolase catalytic core